jgi:hypothetical protein
VGRARIELATLLSFTRILCHEVFGPSDYLPVIDDAKTTLL